MKSLTHHFSSYTACKKLAIPLLIGCLASGCSSTEQPKSDGPTIEFIDNGDNTTFWLYFGLSKLACAQKYQSMSFGESYCTFEMANELSDSAIEKNSDKETPFVKDIFAIKEAGFLKEYIYVFYNQPNWFSEPKLKMDKFKSWMSAELPHHEVSTKAVKVSNALVKKETLGKVQLDSTFIKQSGSIELISQHELAERSHGIRLKYQDAEHADFHADVYVYPKYKFEQLEAGQERNYLVDEMSTVKAGILYYVDIGTYSDFSVVSETLSADNSLATGVYHVEKNAQLMTTVAQVTEHNGVLIKLRSSQARTNPKSYQQALQGIIADLKDHATLVK